MAFVPNGFHSKFQFDLDVKCLHMSPWLGRLGDYSPHYDVRFEFSRLGSGLDDQDSALNF